MWTPALITRIKRKKNEKKKEKENVTIEDYLTIEIKNIIITLMVMGDRSLRRMTLRRVHFVAIISSHDHFVA